MTTQEMFAAKEIYALARALRGIWAFGSTRAEFAAGRKLECDEEGCESDQIKMDIYFSLGRVPRGACLQMIIVSELIIKLDEQPLSSSSAAAAAQTPHIYTHAHALLRRANIRARNIRKRSRERGPERPQLFAFLSLFAECSERYDIYFHRRCVTHKKVYHSASKCWGDEGMLVLTLCG